MRVWVGFLFWGLFSHLTTWAAGPKEGFYLGFAAIEGRTEKIGVCLELERRDLKDRSQLIAFLKLKLGGFSTHEYVSHYYLVDYFNWEAADLVLDGQSSGFGTDITFWKGAVTEEGNRITGRLRSSRGGIVRGQVELVWMGNDIDFAKLDAIFSHLPLVQSLTGQYEGKCRAQTYVLQLEAMKVMDSRKDQFKTMAGFNIGGRVAPVLTSTYHYRRGETFEGLAYNFYTGVLDIPIGEQKCRVERGEVKCGENCSLKRTKFPENGLDDLLVKYDCKKSERIHHFRELEGVPNLEPPYRRQDVEGEYYGLLHLEERDVYKAVSFEVALSGQPLGNHAGAFQPMVSPVLRIFATTAAELDLHKHQTISIPFQPSPFPEEKFNSFWIESDSDMILKVTEWSSAGIKATLFSKNYGKAGTLELIRGEIPEHFSADGLPHSASIEGPFWGKVALSPEDKIQTMSFTINLVPIQNPLAISVSYFPFNLTGPLEISTRRAIVYGYVASGTFDMFTGTVRLNLDSEQVIMGKLIDTGLRGFVSSGFAHLPLRPHRWVDFLHK